MDCRALLAWLEEEGLFKEDPPLLTKDRLCRPGHPGALAIPAPARGHVVAVPEPFYFEPIEALVDAGRTCAHDVPLLTAVPECGVRFFRPLPGRPPWRPPPPSLRSLWVVSPGWNQGPRFSGYRRLFETRAERGTWFAEASKAELFELLAQGVEGLFLIGHGDEENRGFWLQGAVPVRFSELAEALAASPAPLRFLYAFLCESAEALYQDLLLPLARMGRLDRDFGAVLFLGSPLHDYGPFFLGELLARLGEPAAQRDPAPFLFALSRARGALFRRAGLNEAARPIAFSLRPQAHPWPPIEERRYLGTLARMLEPEGGQDGV